MDIRIVETENGRWIVLLGRVGYGPCWAFQTKKEACDKARELFMDMDEEYKDEVST